jgi:hypothetical protein
MLAGGGVQAFIGQSKALDWFASYDVGFDDLLNVSLGDESIPYGLGIDHEIRAVLALIETAGLVGSHFAFEASFCQFLLEEFLQFGLARGIAASPRISWRALVAAYEDVFFELRHKVS